LSVTSREEYRLRVLEEGAREDIWTEDQGGNRRLEETA
jgi:hypothetical protein